MTELPISLALYSPATNTRQGIVSDVTKKIQSSWRRSIRDIGGFWYGTAQWEGSADEMIGIFQTGMMLELRESAGGMTTWEGFLAEMTLTYKGQTYQRSWFDVANRIKVIYSLFGKNLITNNSCETTVWGAYGTPTTRERTTTWATHGDYSAHVVTDAPNEGVIIQSSISIAARNMYEARVTVNIISGTWRLEIYRSDGTVLDYMDQSETGKSIMNVGISEDNQVGGTVGLRLYCTSATGEIYADAAVFQRMAWRAETGWYDDAVSQDEYGVIEYVISESGMNYHAANAMAQTELANRAWARVKPPTQVETIGARDETRLDMVFLGYVYTLRNRYTVLGGQEDYASYIITDIISNSQFVVAGHIERNEVSYYVDGYAQWRDWDVIRNVTLAGDESGNRWTCGVYDGKRFFYEQASDNPVARIRNGKILHRGGELLEGWLARPGMVALDDMPIAYDIGRGVQNRHNMAWMNEVEWDMGDYLKGNSGITYRQVTT